METIYRFVTKPKMLIGASLLRIVLGSIILYFYAIHFHQRHFLFSDSGVMTTKLYLAGAPRDFTNLYGFVQSPLIFEALYIGGMIVAFCFMIGFGRKWLEVANYVLTVSLLNRNFLITDGGDNLLSIVLFWLLFMNTTQYFAFHKAKQVSETLLCNVRQVVHNTAVLLIIMQVCVMYMVSGLYQASGEQWHNGTALYYVLQVDQFALPFFRDWLMQYDDLLVLLTYGSIIVKLAFPFLLFNRYTKYVIVLSICAFHFGIGIVMGLYTFSATMIAVELLIFSDADYRRLQRIPALVSDQLHRIAAPFRATKFQRNHQLTVFFDGYCAFCRQTVATMKTGDYGQLLQFVSFRHDSSFSSYGITMDMLEQRIHLVDQKGNVYDGITAIERMMRCVPKYWILVPFIRLARLVRLGDWAYDYIARRRQIVPSADHCTTECYLPIKGGTLS